MAIASQSPHSYSKREQRRAALSLDSLSHASRAQTQQKSSEGGVKPENRAALLVLLQNTHVLVICGAKEPLPSLSQAKSGSTNAE